MKESNKYYIRTIYTGYFSQTCQLVDRKLDYPVAGFSQDFEHHTFCLAYNTAKGKLKSKDFDSFDKMVEFIHRNYRSMRASFETITEAVDAINATRALSSQLF